MIDCREVIVLDKINTLNYIEIPIVKHCNLNCRYCSHMANVEDAYYMSIDTFKKDLAQMKTMFDEIAAIRLLGGEPLLHPQITVFVEQARLIYPKSEIKIATNGLCILTLKPEVLECFKKNGIIIDITMYKPTEMRANAITQILLTHNVSFYLSPRVWNFQRRMLSEPLSDPNVSWDTCKMRYCVVLMGGMLSACYAPRLIPIAKKRYNKDFDVEGSMISIYDGCSRDKIIEFLNAPHKCCAYCGVPEAVEWGGSETVPDISDWYVDRPMR